MCFARRNLARGAWMIGKVGAGGTDREFRTHPGREAGVTGGGRAMSREFMPGSVWSRYPLSRCRSEFGGGGCGLDTARGSLLRKDGHRTCERTAIEKSSAFQRYGFPDGGRSF
jgi:hypothetical protein